MIISMIASMALDDPDVRQRALTAGLMLIPGAAAVTLGAYLAPYKVPGDVVFVAIMMAATYARRFGKRGTMFGMVGFMTYFFALFLGAKPSMLGWLILALAIGTVISFSMRTLCCPIALTVSSSAPWARWVSAWVAWWRSSGTRWPAAD